MPCTHTEMSKFSNPEDSIFRDLLDQMNLLVMGGLEKQRLAVASQQEESEDRELKALGERMSRLRDPGDQGARLSLPR